MLQHIGEGLLELPATWHNCSVNIFTAEEPGKAGPSVTVNRDRLRSGVDFGEYVKEQLAKLGKQLTDLRIEEQRELVVSDRPARLFEFTWLSPDGGRMHQMLLCVLDGAKIINLVASHGRLMDEALRQQLLFALTSFRLLPSAEQNP